MDDIQFIDKNTTIHEVIKRNIQTNSEKGCEDAFFVGDLGDVIHKYEQWKKLLPTIEPFYAVKCNGHKTILSVMSALGMSFDCASKMEIESILSLGVSSSRIIYTNPHKPISHLKYARDNDVDILTFDCEEELNKIKEVFPNARLVIRILPIVKWKVANNLGAKYGCSNEEAFKLLQMAKDNGQDVIGVSFHVGWACQDKDAYKNTIQQSKVIFDLGKKIGHQMHILDIGGGFLGKHKHHEFFCEVSKTITKTIQDLFSNEKDIKIIAEPGTFFVESALTLAVNITGKRKRNAVDGCNSQTEYYLNDGIYGSFGCHMTENGYTFGFPVPLSDKEGRTLHQSIMWGPTCISIDRLPGEYALPDMDTGEWLLFSDMGAYTISVQSNFNGMPKSKCIFFCDVSYGTTYRYICF